MAGAPLGNKNAVGYGRPYNEGFSNEEIIQIGKDLLTWIKECDEKKSEVVHLSQFYSELKEICYSQWQSIIRRDCFLPYYDRAREWMGKRILNNKELPQSYGNRFLGIYFKEIKDNEREIVEHKVDYEIKKKKEADATQSYPNDKVNDAQLAWIKAQAVIEKQSAKIEELERKINESQPKADQLDQSGK